MAVTNPGLWKAACADARPADVTVVIDSDVVVAAALEPVLELARRGGSARTDPDDRRWFAEWGRQRRVFRPAL